MYSKQFILLTTIICIAVAAGKQISIKVTPQQVLDLREVSKKCAEETGVDPGILAKLIDWTLDEDEQTKAFTYCLSVNYGYIDEDAKINITKMLEYEVIKGTIEEYIEKIKECDQVRKQSKIDTVFEKGNCINEFIETVVIRPSS